MTTTRELHTAPHILPLYARAAAPLVPGASRLPWFGGGGGEIPDLELHLAQVGIDAGRVAEYARVCCFAAGEELPATYPHVLAFPLHLALMTDGGFPLAAVGLVHVANRITQHRPISAHERLDLRVQATPLEPHPRGRTFSLLSEARVAGELVWEELSTMLHRDRRTEAPGERDEHLDGPSPPLADQWGLPADLGRRYAAVSGDRNPIHMHQLSARALGFPRAIVHGMWTKARCLAALEETAHRRHGSPGRRLPEAFRIEVRFRRPILLPAMVGFASTGDRDAVRFWVSDVDRDTSHLEGRLVALGADGEHGDAGR